MKKLFVLLLVSLLVVNCGVDESSESKEYVGSETKSTAKKVGKYALYTVAGIGAVTCITVGLKDACLKPIGRAVDRAFLGAKKMGSVDEAAQAGNKKAIEAQRATKEAIEKGEEVAEDTTKYMIGRDRSKTFYGSLKEKIFGSGKSAKEAGEAGEVADEGAKVAGDATETATEGAESGAKSE